MNETIMTGKCAIIISIEGVRLSKVYLLIQRFSFCGLVCGIEAIEHENNMQMRKNDMENKMYEMKSRETAVNH